MRLSRFLVSSSLLAASLLARNAAADNILLWDGGQSHSGSVNAASVLTGLGHTVTVTSTVPADLTPFDNLWAMDYLNGPDSPAEKAMVATFLNSDRGIYAQFEWDCCTNSQVQWTATLSPLLKAPFLISGSQGVSQNSVAEPAEVFGLTTTPHALPFLQINATANIVTIPEANVVYRLNGIPVVGAYVDPQFVSGDGCIVLSGDIEEVFAAPQAANWIDNVQHFLQNCIPNPLPICGDGFLALAETCDDGNAISGDGCSSACLVEAGYNCVNDTSNTPVSACVATCSPGQTCSVGVGACETQGSQLCDNGVPLCTAVAGDPTAEMCDEIDNDCDGTVDNGFDLGDACSAGVGACAASGVIACDGNGGAACNAVPGAASPETCDGVDNNCNGNTDEGFSLGALCSVGLGLCKVDGTIVCDGGGSAKCSALPACGDSDGDGLSDLDETTLGTNPNDQDSDDDGVIDGVEPSPGGDADGDGIINALDPDSDNDGIFDGTEMGFDCSNVDTNVAAGHCVGDADMGATVTNPLDADTDGGGAGDGSEDWNGNGAVDPGETNPAGQGDDGVLMDSDGDGLSDPLEVAVGTNPKDGDSDDDGVLDGQEVNPTLDSDGDGLINLLDPDSDNDGLFDGTEMGKGCAGADTDTLAGHCIADGDGGATKTNPVQADTDNGGVSDGAEDWNHNGVIDAGEADPTLGHGGDDASVADNDHDGLSDAEELLFGSDPNDSDSDDDGVLDGDEMNPTSDDDGDGLVNANDPDSDNDGIFDGTELGFGCFVQGAIHCVPDGDGGLTNTSPLLPDSDAGGVKDGIEDANHNGVVDPGETDPANPNDDVCVQTSDCAIAEQVCDSSTSKCVDAKCDTMSECPAPDTCHFVGICQPASGMCTYGNKPNGMPCADDNVCTVDTCQSGTCVSVSQLDGTPCTEEGAVGLCIAGHCLVDPKFEETGGAGGAGGSATSGGTGASSAEGGAGGAASTGGTGTGTGGEGAGNGANGDDAAAFSLQGGGCSTSGGNTGSPRAPLAALGLALGLVLARRRRNRDAASL